MQLACPAHFWVQLARLPLFIMHSLCLRSVHKLYVNAFRSRFRTWTCPIAMNELESKMHLQFQTHFAVWDSQRAPSKFKHESMYWMCMTHGDQGGQSESRCTQVHTRTHQHAMHCVHAPHVHSGIVLRTSHMTACAMQCAHWLMHMHVRLELRHQIHIVSWIQRLYMKCQLHFAKWMRKHTL